MLFKLHYWFITAGLSAINILLGVYINTYTDASSLELGVLLMLMPFTGIIFRPIICSVADRTQSYQKCIMYLMAIVTISYSPYIIIPFFGPEFYVERARLSWYILLVFKVLGDIAFGGVQSIGDSLAINYAERTGTEFRVYRIWGTLSWMTFGLIIGQINEVPFLPKYVPAFMIMCISFFFDFIAMWLWPPEYFAMVPLDRSKKSKSEQKRKSIVPREVVLAQMKTKILWLVSFGYYKKSQIDNQTKTFSSPSNILTISNGTLVKSDTCIDAKGKEKVTPNSNDEKIDRKTQTKILVTLLRKDVRIVFYLLLFACAGASIAPLSFFFISLSNICHQDKTCDFSQLAGMLQVSMTCVETVVFVYIKTISDKIGRLNVCAFGIFLCTIKYTFYATIWTGISPYYALLSEMLHGASFGIFLTSSVEMGHLFANEVEFILPDLIEKRYHQGRRGKRRKIENVSCSYNAISDYKCYGRNRTRFWRFTLWFIIRALHF